MTVFPKADIDSVPVEYLDLKLQNPDIQHALHTDTERILTYKILHDALHHALVETYGTGAELNEIATAIDHGIIALEALSHAFMGPDSYDTEIAAVISAETAGEYLKGIRTQQDLQNGLVYAFTRMNNDTPEITRFLSEATERYRQTKAQFAMLPLMGSAVYRGMLIRVNNRLMDTPSVN